MAFGFLKKLVQKITGKSPSAPKVGKGAPNGAKKDGNGGNGGGGGRGRRGKRGRHGNGGGQQQQQRPQSQQQPRQGAQQQRPAGQQQQQRPPRKDGAPAERRGDRGPRRDRGDRGGDRRRDGSRRGPKSVNTAANEMRPGGVVSPEEMAARKAAHAAWDPARPPLGGDARHRRPRFPVLHRDPGAVAPERAGRQEHRRQGADRERQDGCVPRGDPHALPPHARVAREDRRHAARARDRAHARARDPDLQGRRRDRQVLRPSFARRLRRHGHGPPARGAAGGARGPARRDARASAGLLPAPRRGPPQRGHARDRRGGPHARHGLHPRRAPHHVAPAAEGQARHDARRRRTSAPRCSTPPRSPTT